MSKFDRFPALLRAFFYEWLIEQRNASIPFQPHPAASHPGSAMPACSPGSTHSEIMRRNH
ncbi:hypothetical protein LJR098_003596 [Rhizobium sp. LjRoot98]|uniref:hypothetical protein n=1 Tax=unclassified Rhizobium TaxID=2613769 RepID=UPI000B16DDD0|nr:hypothetical protein [Rhizobium sp. Root1204]